MFRGVTKEFFLMGRPLFGELIKSPVPQESVLGALFLIYINDLQDNN